jgi:hypothetical protein
MGITAAAPNNNAPDKGRKATLKLQKNTLPVHFCEETSRKGQALKRVYEWRRFAVSRSDYL